MKAVQSSYMSSHKMGKKSKKMRVHTLRKTKPTSDSIDESTAKGNYLIQATIEKMRNNPDGGPISITFNDGMNMDFMTQEDGRVEITETHTGRKLVV